ncbi:hypothetical protein C8D83_103118 [Halothiobacillus neapolitanus]|nr:hypothetical protein C8D83_103118 [Halothiobacillus neapolitanus]
MTRTGIIRCCYRVSINEILNNFILKFSEDENQKM